MGRLSSSASDPSTLCRWSTKLLRRIARMAFVFPGKRPCLPSSWRSCKWTSSAFRKAASAAPTPS
eukprot:3485816-Alexandrium_andersonii.AAC.1